MVPSPPTGTVNQYAMNNRAITTITLVLLGAALAILAGACTPFRNFTTYFNLFYNMERIMEEVEDELLYTREQKVPQPVFVIPYDDLGRGGAPFYDHLERRTMTSEETRANKIKLDSILLKGSKLLAYRSASEFVDDALFYMAKGYFYEREWFLSQRKCDELIANFPDSRWLPDAHLVLSMDLMHLGSQERADVMLSRTIDIAWAHRRADILSEAFRLNADVALAQGDADRALRPYYRAIVFGDDDTEKARWQHEIGMIFYKQGDFLEALRRLDSVDEYSPDILTQFETGLQRAASLRALARYDEASRELDGLEENGNFEPWWGMVAMERVNLATVQTSPSGPLNDSAVAGIDSVPGGRGYSAYVVYERGVRAFRAGEYREAMQSFARAQTANAPFQRRARTYALYLTQYFDQTSKAQTLHGALGPTSFPDTIRSLVADHYYNTARVFVNLGVGDSMDQYYGLAHRWAPQGSLIAARSIYALGMRLRELGRQRQCDSLLEILVNDSDYSLTEYAADARRRLGYTENAKFDPAEELYLSGKQFARVGETSRALSQYQRVVATYPTSNYAPLALYAMGLLFEGPLDNGDSAYSYYVQLVRGYPSSEQALDVRPLLEAYNAYRMQQPANLNGIDSTRRNDGLVPLDEKPHSLPRDPASPLQNPEAVDGQDMTSVPAQPPSDNPAPDTGEPK